MQWFEKLEDKMKMVKVCQWRLRRLDSLSLFVCLFFFSFFFYQYRRSENKDKKDIKKGRNRSVSTCSRNRFRVADKLTLNAGRLDTASKLIFSCNSEFNS